MKKYHHILFFVSVVCFSLSAYLYVGFDKFTSEEILEQNAFAEIQFNLAQKSEGLKKEVKRAEKFLNSGEIKEFVSEKAIFYISNQEILHWTNYHVPYNQIFSSGNTSWGIYKTTQGVFLIYKQELEELDPESYLIGVIDMYRDYQLSSSFLKSGYNKEIFENFDIKRKSIVDDGGMLLEVDGFPLWKIEIDTESLESRNVLVVWMSLLVIGFLCLLYYVIVLTRYFMKLGKYLSSLLVVICFLTLVRGGMHWSEFPQHYFDIKLFEPQLFASSSINSSFGDLFLNVLCVFIITLYAYFSIVRSVLYPYFVQVKSSYIALCTSLLLFFSFVVSLFIYSMFFSIYSNSQVNFDITENINLGSAELLYIAIFILLIGIFFLTNHFVLRSVFILNKKNSKVVFKHIILQVIVCTAIEYFLFRINIWSPFVIGIYLAVCIRFLFFTNFIHLQYKSYVYLTLSALISSLIIASIVTRISSEKDFVRKAMFADHLILHNDIQGEYLMSEVAKDIRADAEIINNVGNGLVTKDKVEEKVKKEYLSSYFDKYEVRFSYFNSKGKPYYKNELLGDLSQVKSSYTGDKYKTWLNGLFFITNFKKDFLSKYYHFIEVEKAGKVVGTIVVDYTLKKYIDRSILPGLLQLSEIEGYKNIDKYNYAIYSNQKLQYRVGEFNYNSKAFVTYLNDKETHSKDLIIDNYHHLILSGVDGKMIVVSSLDNKWFKILTNFSFHFLVLVLITLVFLIVNALIYFSKNKTSDFSTKIQTYLNIATFAPMILLSVLILGLISTSNRSDQETKFKNIAESLSSHVLNYLEDFQNRSIDMYQFKNSIDRLSRYSGADINIYDKNGRLMLSNQTLLYETGVMSTLLNPRAATELFEMKHRLVELEEDIGEFKYNTVYVSLTKPETSEFLGVMSIPFFNSTHQIEQKKISALAIIINVFAVAFVLLLITSFFVTKSLISPLKLIANKLRKVETGQKNEPLVWGANDELGLLVTEYNLMLEKIEESKKNIAQVEKEQAWKDMAKQVAHEIKNPLTPMKLKLQHLKRLKGEDEKTVQAIDSLLEQVETLSDIATSFSSFAKMPTPVISCFNLSEVCIHVTSLYENNKDYDLICDIEPNVFINGDDKLLGRILTNLILNGIQSASSDTKPLIYVALRKVRNSKIVLSVRDNGSGIPEEIRNKVFIPNFTTKYTGSGIGLAVAKNGIEQMNGQIYFETVIDKGTVFFIEFSGL